MMSGTGVKIPGKVRKRRILSDMHACKRSSKRFDQGHDSGEDKLSVSAEELSTLSTIMMNEPEMDGHQGDHDHHFVVVNNNHDWN